MATSCSKVVLVFAVFMFLELSEARILNHFQAPNNIIVLTDNQVDSVLSRIGFSPFEIKEYKRRSLNAGTDRVAPSGPDPHHHSLPPMAVQTQA
nr:CLAVATA3/ESR (CLE)-related protein 5-like [Ipomoea batatas]